MKQPGCRQSSEVNSAKNIDDVQHYMVHPYIWHYTTGEKFKMIADSSVLLTESETTPHALPLGVMGGVWFSSNQHWERTAEITYRDDIGKIHALDMDGTCQRGGGLVRIGIRLSSDILPWKKYAPSLPTAHMQGLIKAAEFKRAVPGEWFVSLEAVVREHWAAVDIWHANKWKRVLGE